MEDCFISFERWLSEYTRTAWKRFSLWRIYFKYDCIVRKWIRIVSVQTLRWNHDCSVGEFRLITRICVIRRYEYLSGMQTTSWGTCRQSVWYIKCQKHRAWIVVVKEESNKVLVNRYGKIVLPMWMDKIGDFVGNYAECRKRACKYNFINTRGQLVSQNGLTEWMILLMDMREWNRTTNTILLIPTIVW